MNKNIFKITSNHKKKNIDVKLEFSEIEQNSVINNNEYKKLINYKNKIEQIEDTSLWDKSKKFTNDYELIYLPNKKIKCNSISKYDPLSRAYFKLFEILVDFDLINHNKILDIASLAEGPGGFIEAIINYRKRIHTKKDNLFGITLKSISKDIPGWNKARMFLKKNSNVSIHYGEDGTGNLYNLENIIHFKNTLNKKMDFVTADGGFDFSYNFNRQEQLSYRIIFCEMVTTLSIQKKGGSFVCKFFDIYTDISQSFIYLLFLHYDEVFITKPNTSRSANSEKYIVCRGFKGIDEIILKKLYIIVKNFDYIYKNDMFINKIFEYKDDNFKSNLNTINTKLFNLQINTIERTLDIIKNKKYDDTFNENTYNQSNLAFNWCKYYKVSINYNSKYLIKYKSIIKKYNK